MADILTPKQVARCKSHIYRSTPFTVGQLCDSHEELRQRLATLRELRELERKQLTEVTIQRDSWQATAEELADKNVNKSLRQRHEMREAKLKNQLAEAQADVQALVAAYPECFVCAGCGPLVKADEDGLCANCGAEVVIRPTLEALACPSVKQLMEEV